MNILVIGDVMLDVNYVSKIERTAPEADIPIHNITHIDSILGGAANVAVNLHNLNTNVELISVIGEDDCGRKIKSLLEEKKILYKLFIDKERKSTLKNRIFNQNSIHVRYDIEDTFDISLELEQTIIDYILKKKEINAIILSDYNKGVLTYKLAESIINFSLNQGIYTFVDPKIKNYLKYKNCFCFKPNLLEAQEISGKVCKKEIMEFIKKSIQCENIVLTCGKDGILVNNPNNPILHSKEVQVVDVTGAGDIVLTVLVYIFLKEKNIYIASQIANFIAGKSVQVIGNYQLNPNLFEHYLPDQLIKVKDTDKIIFSYEIEKIKMLSQKKNIVFTNGCFDILHSGHIKNLQFAKKQGDLLVVGLNSDDSVKRLKGESRPINDITERSEILSLFNFIDFIIIFEEDTPLSILKNLKPKILIKGSDYKKENLIGTEYVEEIILFDYISNKSTSLIIDKIIKKRV